MMSAAALSHRARKWVPVSRKTRCDNGKIEHRARKWVPVSRKTRCDNGKIEHPARKWAAVSWQHDVHPPHEMGEGNHAPQASLRRLGCVHGGGSTRASGAICPHTTAVRRSRSPQSGGGSSRRESGNRFRDNTMFILPHEMGEGRRASAGKKRRAALTEPPAGLAASRTPVARRCAPSP
jgi:hypothetical protein